jgi:hypothetical protein
MVISTLDIEWDSLSQIIKNIKNWHCLLLNKAKKSPPKKLFVALEGFEPPSPTKHNGKQTQQESKKQTQQPGITMVTIVTCGWCSTHWTTKPLFSGGGFGETRYSTLSRHFTVSSNAESPTITELIGWKWGFRSRVVSCPKWRRVRWRDAYCPISIGTLLKSTPRGMIPLALFIWMLSLLACCSKNSGPFRSSFSHRFCAFWLF